MSSVGEHGKDQRRRKHSCFGSIGSQSSGSGGASDGSENDFTCTSQCKRRKRTQIPQCTYAWDMWSLKTLSIFYELRPCPLSEILNKSGHFPPLNTDLDEVLTLFKNSLSFDVQLNEVIEMNNMEFGDFVRSSLQGAKRSVVELARASDKMYFIVKPVLDFIDDTNFMLLKMRILEDTADVVKQFFSSFISMCQLSPKNGTLYTQRKSIKGIDVTSYPDLKIECKNGKHIIMENNTEAVVSIVKLKQFTENPLREENSGAPRICQKLDKTVPGQHGGKLLLEWQKYKTCVPGMIVVGSKIIFTLLDLTSHHMEKLCLNEDLDEDETASICYTESFDMLKKEDRNVLMETFLRLSMSSGLYVQNER